jgi:copper transport protein
VVTLNFTGEAEPTGAGFQLLDSNGDLREPAEAITEDGKTWTLRFDPAVAGGTVGLRWSVQAPDAHPISGSFSFTVTAGTAATTQTQGTPDAKGIPAGSGGDLDSFLEVEGDDTGAGDRLGALGRVVTLLGTLLGVGALVFAATALRGTPRDVRHVMHWVRRAGVLVLVGAFLELIAQLSVAGGGWSGVWSPATVVSVVGSSFGIAIGLRLLGGVALLVGARLDTAPAVDLRDPVAAITDRVRVGAGVHADQSGRSRGHRLGPGAEAHAHPGEHAWAPTTESSMAFLGAAALLAAHLFDGHTVTKGPRLVTAAVNVVHVAGAAVWAGGVAMLLVVLWRRHREGRASRAAQLALRFSVVATLAIVAVGAAGVLLAVIILDSPSELWATEWGRLLIAKTVFVVAAAAAGAYNHRVLVPQMSRDPDSPELSTRFRSVITVEAAALLVVLILTAFLMGAAS